MSSVTDRNTWKSYNENDAEEQLKTDYPGCTVEKENYSFIVKNMKGEVVTVAS